MFAHISVRFSLTLCVCVRVCVTTALFSVESNDMSVDLEMRKYSIPILASTFAMDSLANYTCHQCHCGVCMAQSPQLHQLEIDGNHFLIEIVFRRLIICQNIISCMMRSIATHTPHHTQSVPFSRISDKQHLRGSGRRLLVAL